MKHEGRVRDILVVLESQMKCFTLKIVAYFKCLTCLYARAQDSCFWEVTGQKLTHKVNNWRKPCSHMSLFFNSIGRIIQNFLRKALKYKTKLVFEFFEAVDYKNTFRKPVNIYNTVSVLIQHYYFQGQYYTCSFLELHILVLFLSSDRASCTVASSTLFTNTPKLQLPILLVYLAIAKRRVILIIQ